MIEGLPLSTISFAINILGLPGLIFVVWYVDQRRLDKVLRRYDKDMARVVRMYEDNITLVQGYQNLASDLSSIIHLNTQAQTHLVEVIKNNQFCPTVRAGGGKQ